MVIKKEIFDDFISKLKENEEFPDDIVDSIEKKWDMNRGLTKEEILEEIQNEHKD